MTIGVDKKNKKNDVTIETIVWVNWIEMMTDNVGKEFEPAYFIGLNNW